MFGDVFSSCSWSYLIREKPPKGKKKTYYCGFLPIGKNTVMCFLSFLILFNYNYKYYDLQVEFRSMKESRVESQRLRNMLFIRLENFKKKFAVNNLSSDVSLT